jgi:hypothetical protein
LYFRQHGRRIKVLNYEGYDRVKEQPVIRMLGSIDAYTLEPSPGLLEKLDASGRAELDAYITSQKQRSADAHLAYLARTMPTDARDLARAIECGRITPDDAWRSGVADALQALAKALGSPAVAPAPMPAPTSPTKESAAEPAASDNVLYLIAVLAVAWLAARYASPVLSWLSSLWR